jgi:adhesin/invasin
VNAQVPPDLQVNTQNEILVQRNSVPSVASQISVSAASPAIFTQNSSGTGQGAITNAITGAVANASNPVTPGVDYVSIYCTGLGVTNPAIAAGQPAPSSPPFAPTVNTATVTIGGLPAQVLYAGLAPTYAGLYQVNAAVPAGLSPGNQPVVVSIAGQSSPPGVTIAVK